MAFSQDSNAASATPHSSGRPYDGGYVGIVEGDGQLTVTMADTTAQFAANGAHLYRIKIATDAAGPYTVAGTKQATRHLSQGTLYMCDYTINNLTNETPYYIKVALDDIPESG